MYWIIIVIVISFFFLIHYRKKKKSPKSTTENELDVEVTEGSEQVPSKDIIKSKDKSIDFEELTIPKYRQKLLYISPGKPFNTGLTHSVSINLNTGIKTEEHGPDEPSAIFIKQPIKRPKKPDSVQELGYFPSYAQMNPSQKWIYLNWLCDITKTVDIGYVFTYYYGLERRLIDNQLEEAFKEINLLRKYHKNNSFQSYSLKALINAINIKKRFDLIEAIYIDEDYDKTSNAALYVSYKLKLNLQSEVLISIVNSISGTNRRYIKKNRDIYRETLDEVLKEKYSKDFYPFTKLIDVKDIKKKDVKGFANYSLPDEYQLLSYPDFLGHNKFTSDVLECHKEAHERTKKKLHQLRKKRKNT
jgi:hypothetical protein